MYVAKTNCSGGKIVPYSELSFCFSWEKKTFNAFVHRCIAENRTLNLKMKARIKEGQECNHRLRFRGKRDARRAPRAD